MGLNATKVSSDSHIKGNLTNLKSNLKKLKLEDLNIKVYSEKELDALRIKGYSLSF